jgi:fumarate reductase (CoM/CoB) subunit B
MEQSIKVVVFRYDPAAGDPPRYDEFRVDAGEEMSVLLLLDKIQKEIDPTLGFRAYCCGLQMCRSCLVKINRKNRLACITLVKPGEEVLVEPATFSEKHIRDLVVSADYGEES